jgi:hypothetical protein
MPCACLDLLHLHVTVSNRMSILISIQTYSTVQRTYVRVSERRVKPRKGGESSSESQAKHSKAKSQRTVQSENELIVGWGKDGTSGQVFFLSSLLRANAFVERRGCRRPPWILKENGHTVAGSWIGKTCHANSNTVDGLFETVAEVR